MVSEIVSFWGVNIRDEHFKSFIIEMDKFIDVLKCWKTKGG